MEQTQVNQQIIFDMFLKEQYGKQVVFNNTKEIMTRRFGSYFTDLKEYITIMTMENGNKFPLKELAHNMDMNEKFEEIYHRNFAKEFFEWAKKKEKEMGLPNTFKYKKETKIIATTLLEEWYGRFETSEEMVNWLEGENDIMLK
jgi:hypothetical protein